MFAVQRKGRVAELQTSWTLHCNVIRSPSNIQVLSKDPNFVRLEKGKYSLHAFHPHLVVPRQGPGQHGLGFSPGRVGDFLQVVGLKTALVTCKLGIVSCAPGTAHL